MKKITILRSSSGSGLGGFIRVYVGHRLARSFRWTSIEGMLALESRIKKALGIALIVFFACVNVRADVLSLARANGFSPSPRIVGAIYAASYRYQVDPLELTAIGILETGLGRNVSHRINRNGTVDTGIFQVNTVNKPYCIEYNLESMEGSSFCAAKLLRRIKLSHASDPQSGARYHSNSRIHKQKYFLKMIKVLAIGAE